MGALSQTGSLDKWNSFCFLFFSQDLNASFHCIFIVFTFLRGNITVVICNICITVKPKMK